MLGAWRSPAAELCAELQTLLGTGGHHRGAPAPPPSRLSFSTFFFFNILLPSACRGWKHATEGRSVSLSRCGGVCNTVVSQRKEE